MKKIFFSVFILLVFVSELLASNIYYATKDIVVGRNVAVMGEIVEYLKNKETKKFLALYDLGDAWTIYKGEQFIIIEEKEYYSIIEIVGKDGYWIVFNMFLKDGASLL